MTFLNSNQIRSYVESMGNQYEILEENKVKLEADCEKLREHIEAQISKIQALNQDFEKLRLEYLQRKGEIKKEQPLNQLEEQNDQDWFIKPLTNNNDNKIIINLDAEIVDVSVISCTSFSPDGTCLAIGSNRTIRVYNIDNDGFVFQYQLKDEDENKNIHLRSISWTPDQKQLICGGEDKKIYIFDMPNGNLISNFIASDGEIYQVQTSNKSNYFATVAGDGYLNLWAKDNFKQIWSIRKDNTESLAAACLSISHDDNLIVVGYADNTIAFFDINKKIQIGEFQVHNQGVYSVRFLSNMKKLITSSLDKTIKIWDIIYKDDKINLNLWKTLDKHNDFVLSLDLDFSGKYLLSGSKDTTAILSSIENGEMLYSINSHTNAIISVSCNPKRNMFCTGSGDRSVKIWSFENL